MEKNNKDKAESGTNSKEQEIFVSVCHSVDW